MSVSHSSCEASGNLPWPIPGSMPSPPCSISKSLQVSSNEPLLCFCFTMNLNTSPWEILSWFTILSNKFYFTSIDICVAFILASIIYSWGGGFIPTDVSHTYKILYIFIMLINLILVNYIFWKMLKACLNFFCVQCRYLCNILYLCIIDNIKVSIM